MQFFVLGVDAPDVQERLEALSEAHWGYLDGFADRLVARGPTLTPDGETHTGSVHVVEMADAVAAQRFASEEPFCCAGLYASVHVRRFHNAVGGTMWDRPAVKVEGSSALVLGTWPAEPVVATLDARWLELTGAAGEESVVFGGLLVSDDGADVQGLVLAVDRSLEEAELLVASLSVPASATVTVHRWRRGGRSA